MERRGIPVRVNGVDTPVQSLELPDLEPLPLEPVADWMALARELRPSLNEARLRVQRGELEVIRTRQALTALYRQSGSLLLHRGIEAPGDQSVMF